MGRSGRYLVVFLLLLSVSVLTVAVSLLINADTDPGTKWPGLLEVLHRHPWPFTFALIPVSAVVAFIAWRAQSVTERDFPTPLRPPQVQVLPNGIVPRPAELRLLVDALCRRSNRTVSVAAALEGAGGFGKTTLARMACDDPRVRRFYRGRIYFFPVGREVRGDAAITRRVNELIYDLTGERGQADNPRSAAQDLGRWLDKYPRILLILDDVWQPDQLTPFLVGGRRCTRLVTTRVSHTLPDGTASVTVGGLSEAQAHALLTWQLPPLEPDVANGLLAVCRRWPLLLRLVNGRVSRDVNRLGVDVGESAADALASLRAGGPAGLDYLNAEPTIQDLDDPDRRNLAVRITVEASTALLPERGATRFLELGIFPAGERIPRTLIEALWAATANLDKESARALMTDLAALALVTIDPVDGGTVLVHDAIRDYQRSAFAPDEIAAANYKLTEWWAASLPAAREGMATRPWWLLVESEGYAWDHLIYHLVESGNQAEAESVAADLRWIMPRLLRMGPQAVGTDLSLIETERGARMFRSYLRISHLLAPTEPPDALLDIIRDHLGKNLDWMPQFGDADSEAGRVRLAERWSLPEIDRRALYRVFAGERYQIRAITMMPDGSGVLAGTSDGSLLLLNPYDGSVVEVWGPPLHSPVEALTVSLAGGWTAVAYQDGQLLLRDLSTGAVRVLRRRSWRTRLSTAWRRDAVRSSGWRRWYRSLRRRSRILLRLDVLLTRAWDRLTSGVTTLALVAPADGSFLITGDNRGRIEIWDPQTGKRTGRFGGAPDDEVEQMSLSAAGDYLLVRVGSETLEFDVKQRKLNELKFINERFYQAVVSPDARWIVGRRHSRYTYNILIGDRQEGILFPSQQAYPEGAKVAAISPDSNWAVLDLGGGGLATVDIESGFEDSRFQGHAGHIDAVAISPNSQWLAVLDGPTVRIWMKGWNPDHLVPLRRGYRVWPTTGTELVISGYEDVTVHFVDPDDGHTRRTAGVALFPFESVVGVASNAGQAVMTDSKARVVNLREQGVARKVATDRFDSFALFVVSPDASHLAVGHYFSGSVLMIELVSGEQSEVLRCRARIAAMTFDPGGAILYVAAGDDVQAVELDRGAGRQLRPRRGAAVATLLATASTLYVGHEDSRISIVDAATGAEVGYLSGEREITCLALSPDGSLLAGGYYGGSLRVWDLSSRQCVAMTRVDTTIKHCVWFTEGTSLVVSGQSGVFFFDLSDGRTSPYRE